MSNMTSYNMTLFNVTDIVPAAEEEIPKYVGYIAVVISMLCFGSNFVPVKKFETGDGIFFQLIMCVGIFPVGVIIQAVRGSTVFSPLVILGGALWCIGNTGVVIIIKTIGLGLGLCIWALTNLLSGWFLGRFGLFGTIAKVPKNEIMNYLGVAAAVLSILSYTFVKTEVSSTNETSGDLVQGQFSDQKLPLNQRDEPNGDVNLKPDADVWFVDKMKPLHRRVLGTGLAVFAGILYGFCFAPTIYIQERVSGASQNALDYVFSHFVGILLAATVIFVVYSAYMKNMPKVYPRVILPGLISGVMWAIADACWFVANKTLSETVSMPLILVGPAIVSTLWGILVFKEIKGKRNLLILLLAFVFSLACGVLTGMSNV